MMNHLLLTGAGLFLLTGLTAAVPTRDGSVPSAVNLRRMWPFPPAQPNG